MTKDYSGSVKIQITRILPVPTAESHYVHIKPLCTYFRLVKVKFTLEQATKAQVGSRDTALLFF